MAAKRARSASPPIHTGKRSVFTKLALKLREEKYWPDPIESIVDDRYYEDLVEARLSFHERASGRTWALAEKEAWARDQLKNADYTKERGPHRLPHAPPRFPPSVTEEGDWLGPAEWNELYWRPWYRWDAPAQEALTLTGAEKQERIETFATTFIVGPARRAASNPRFCDRANRRRRAERARSPPLPICDCCT